MKKELIEIIKEGFMVGIMFGLFAFIGMFLVIWLISGWGSNILFSANEKLGFLIKVTVVVFILGFAMGVGSKRSEVQEK